MTIKAVVFDAYGTLYDVQSVAEVTEDAFPGYGEIITQIWRIKQLEYSWLRSLMRRYQDFSVVTRNSLAYTLRSLGLQYDAGTFDRIIAKYLHLDLYPDALASLEAMKDKKLAILSNGSPDMLNALVRNSGLDRVLDATISVDTKKVFKPSPEAYTLIEDVLGVPPAEVLFISSNPWDACGAKAFGLNVAWIERVTPQAMALACVESETLPPLTMFKALRTQMDELGVVPDHRIHALSDLPALLSSHRSSNMSLESVRAFFAEKAPDIAVIESTKSSATVALAAEAYGVEPGRIAKTLSLRVGERVVLIVTSGTSRMDNKKVKALFGIKPKMLGLHEVAEITGHEVGGVCPFGLRTPLPVYCDMSLKAFDIVVPAAGSNSQRGQDRASTDGGIDVGRMGRRLRASAAGGSLSLFVIRSRRCRLMLHRRRRSPCARRSSRRHM